MSDIYKVVTPENIELDYEIAGIGSRFLALFIDMFIQTSLLLGLLFLFDLLKLNNLESKITELSTSITGAILIGLLFVILIGYYIILETVMNGQTIGKKIVNIRVRKEGGYAPSFWDILLRNIIRLADFFPSFYGTGLIVMFLNKKSKRLGDYAAGTIVVKEISRRKIDQFLNEQPTNLEPSETFVIIEKHQWVSSILPALTEQDYLLIKNLLTRRNELKNINNLALMTVNKILSQNELRAPEEISETEALPILETLAKLYENTFFN